MSDTSTREKQLIKEFLDFGTANGFGDLSMLVPWLFKAEASHSHLIEEITLMKKKSGTRTNYICPKCRYFGVKGTYCMYDRHKLVEETESWEEQSDEYYNQALDDVISLLKRKGEKNENKIRSRNKSNFLCESS